MQLEQDLPIVRDVRSDTQNDSDFLELNCSARNLVPCCALLATLRAHIENTNWNFLADENFGFTIVERHDARLCLKIGELNFLKRVEETRELEFSEGR